MPQYKYYINDQEFEPKNTGDYTHDLTLEQEGGFYQFVYSLSGAVLFGHQVYSFVLEHGDCQRITFRVEESTSKGTFDLLNGYFTNRDCSFDHDKKEVKVTPTAETAYQCIKDNWDVNFNFLEFGQSVSSIYSPSPKFEFEATTGFGSGEVLEFPFYGPRVLVQPSQPPFLIFSVFVRELRTTYCVGGELQPPAGDGWEVYIDKCSTNNQATWWRKPLVFVGPPLLFGINFDDNTSTSLPVPVPASPNGEDWLRIKDFDAGSGTYIGLFVDYNVIRGEDLELTNGRELVDVLNFGLNKIGCEDLDVQSRFFTSEINPVTSASPNPMNEVQLHAISDVKDPEATEKASLEKTTLKEIIEGYVYGRCNCRARADEKSQRLIIEHISEFLGALTYDITGFQLSDTEDFDNSDIPRAEEFPSLDSSIDFTGVDIKYFNDCAKDNKAYLTDKFYSEVESIITDPEEYPSDGIVMITPNSLAPTEAGAIGVGAENGAITDDFRPNMPQGQANLHEAYWKYFRPFPIGEMNFNTESFEQNRPVKKIPQVSVPLCELGGSVFLFDPYAYFEGESNGVPFEKGLLQKFSFSEKTNRATLDIQFYE